MCSSFIQRTLTRLESTGAVTCVRSVAPSKEGTIEAREVTTSIGRTTLEVLRSTSVDGIDAQLIISSSLAGKTTDSNLSDKNQLNGLMCFIRSADGKRIQAISRIPIFSDATLRQGLELAVDQLVQLQPAALLPPCTTETRRLWRKLDREFGGRAPRSEVVGAAVERLSPELREQGFRIVGANTGMTIVSDGDRDIEAPRIDVRVRGSVDCLFFSGAHVELVIPASRILNPDLFVLPDKLNASEREQDDGTVGLGAWFADEDDQTLRYTSYLPYSDHWEPRLDLFVLSMISRWKTIEERVAAEARVANSLWSGDASVQH